MILLSSVFGLLWFQVVSEKKWTNEIGDFFDEVKNGQCSVPRFDILLRQWDKCISNLKLDITSPNITVDQVCSFFESGLNCYDIFIECYTSKQVHRLKRIVISSNEQVFESYCMLYCINNNCSAENLCISELIRSCDFYDLYNSGTSIKDAKYLKVFLSIAVVFIYQ